MSNPDAARAAPQSFSYGRLIVETRLSGLAAMIACHCEPVYYSAEIPFLRLELPQEMQPMRETPAMRQFEAALTDYFGEGLELEVVEGPALKSPAALSSAKKVDALTKAHEALMNDEMVQALLKDFGGKILVETIEPASAAPARKPA